MPKVKIVSVPRYFAGGPYDITTTTTMPIAPVLQQEERDFYGCIIGKEQWSDADQMCMPIEGGYNPRADQNKNQPIIPVLNTAGQTVGGPGSTQRPPAVGTDIELKCPDGYVKNKKGQCVPKGRTLRTINDITRASLVIGSTFAQIKQNAESDAAFKKDFRNKMFTGPTSSPGREFLYGNVETNTGVQFPGSMTPVNEGMFSNQFYGAKEFGGEVTTHNNQKKMKIKILETPDVTPKMKYGGQSGYSLDLGWKRGYTEMNKTSSDYFKNSVSKDDSAEEPPVLEAEARETLYKPGDQTMFTIQGKRHSEGGVPLTQEQVSSESNGMPSFIFSDTNKLKIKDKNILKHFGMTAKKGGVTPAKISKRFDLNQYKAILEDVNSDPLAKKTAEFMIQKNERKLAELAAVQEAMKGNTAPQFVEQKMDMARHGGYIPGYGADISIPDLNSIPLMTFAEGGPAQVTITTTAPPTEGVLFTPEQMEAFRKKKLKASSRAQKGDVKIPYHQDAQKTGVYGDISMEDVEDLKARHPWYFKDKPNWDPTSKTDVGDFQKRYNEEYAKKHGFVYFVPQGAKGDRKFNRLDSLLGEFTYNAPALDEDAPAEQPKDSGYTIVQTTTIAPKAPERKWICLPDQNGKGQVQATDSGIGYDSPEEAAQNCGKMPVKPPFDYLAPDKLNMLGKAALFPKKIRPFSSDMAFNPRQLNLQDWRARTAQMQSTMYNAPSQQLAQYTGSQGLASNLSALAGQAAEKMISEGMAPVIGWNIEQSNRFTEDEAKRQDTVNAYNNLQQQDRYKGYAVGEQNYMNALRGYIKENSDAFTRAWNNRMNMGDINDSMQHYYKDPTTGRNVFYNPNMRGVAGLYPGSTGANDAAMLGNQFSAFYSAFNKQLQQNSDLTAAEKKEQAIKLAQEAVRAARVTSAYNAYDPTKSRTTSQGFDFD